MFSNLKSFAFVQQTLFARRSAQKIDRDDLLRYFPAHSRDRLVLRVVCVPLKRLQITKTGNEGGVKRALKVQYIVADLKTVDIRDNRRQASQGRAMSLADLVTRFRFVFPANYMYQHLSIFSRIIRHSRAVN